MLAVAMEQLQDTNKNMYIDSTFYNKLQELHRLPFDWETHNCGLFTAKMLEFMYNKDFSSDFVGKCTSKEAAFALIAEKGGWHNVLVSAGFVKRTDDSMYAGDVVLCENALGISDGYKGLFAGRVFRSRDKIEAVYQYNE